MQDEKKRKKVGQHPGVDQSTKQKKSKPKKLKRARGALLRALMAGRVPVPPGYVDPRLPK
jgi:hypothetical protein